MNHRFTFLFFTFFSILSLSAQDFLIKGTLIDKDMQTPLDAATVYVETPQDSVLVAYSITEPDGSFRIEGKTNLKSLVFLPVLRSSCGTSSKSVCFRPFSLSIQAAAANGHK